MTPYMDFEKILKKSDFKLSFREDIVNLGTWKVFLRIFQIRFFVNIFLLNRLIFHRTVLVHVILTIRRAILGAVYTLNLSFTLICICICYPMIQSFIHYLFGVFFHTAACQLKHQTFCTEL